ncbi:MAG TPA: ATP-dependent chaperone ClpB, partial [Rhodobacteraceae bacterium]|nr:ATP-dependent chaperone ClpB [Paracoccaceae bacterium]
LNRLDEIIIFDRLSRDDMTGIVDIQVGLLVKRLARRNIGLEMDEAARKWLADRGYDPVFGARPLKRVIQHELQDRLAELLLAGDVMDGDIVSVTADEDGLIITSRRGPGSDEAELEEAAE